MNRPKNTSNINGAFDVTETVSMRLIIPFLFLAIFSLTACSMFTAWRSIPPPGGCDECHKVPITSNWQLSIKPVTLTDENNRLSFQTEEATMPRLDKPASNIDRRKVEEVSCFACHNAPDASHKAMKGKFHH